MADRFNRPSTRKGNQTLAPSAIRTSGAVSVSRKTINQPNQETLIVLPDWAYSAVFKNGGNVQFELRFGDNAEDDHWTMPQGYETPIIPITKDTVIKVKNTGANATLECLFYG